MSGSANEDGAALKRADNTNRNRDYPDVEASNQATLLSLGTETYGRWGQPCITLVRQLARLRCKDLPDFLQKSVQQACFSRWWNMLAVSVQRIVTESILRLNGSDLFEASEFISQLKLDTLLDQGR